MEGKGKNSMPRRSSTRSLVSNRPLSQPTPRGSAHLVSGTRIQVTGGAGNSTEGQDFLQSQAIRPCVQSAPRIHGPGLGISRAHTVSALSTVGPEVEAVPSQKEPSHFTGQPAVPTFLAHLHLNGAINRSAPNFSPKPVTPRAASAGGILSAPPAPPLSSTSSRKGSASSVASSTGLGGSLASKVFTVERERDSVTAWSDQSLFTNDDLGANHPSPPSASPSSEASLGRTLMHH
jgi:hypothetical protein